MFTRNEVLLLILACVLVTTAFLLMAFDPEPHGFGSATLAMAPPLLLTGLLLPIVSIVGISNPLRPIGSSPWKTIKNLAGLFVFSLSLTIYLRTLEPTASLWDCSEFIAAAYKLQVPHTPGTPLSLLIAKIFTYLSFGDPTRVAVSINAMSALFSAATVWLVYEIIYKLSDNLLAKSKSPRSLIALPAAVCGSLCLAFSDSFWFSAVEAETYGAACFFLVLIFWLILDGVALSGTARRRRLMLTFYIAGLGYCIHPMCLLAIPVLPLAWYKGKSNLVKTGLLFGAGMLLVLGISRLVAVGLFEWVFLTDLFAVNTLHLPFYSGVVILAVLFIGLGFFLLRTFPRFTASIWSSIWLVLGFTPYLLLFIRSNHNPPIDETNPENLAMIKAYMNRETYPSSPLLYGPYFDAQVDAIQSRKTVYHPGSTKYEVSGDLASYHYESERCTILPRMYSTDPDHIAAYQSWTELPPGQHPTFAQNLQFMLSYQVGYMYLRYLFWNFAGRDGDHQGARWLRPWEGPGRASSANVNTATNQLFAIPLMLGLVGMWFQLRGDKQSFFSVLAFFMATGLILVLYLNSTPNEPRERDYIYVGSYIAYAIWIGLGLSGIAMAARRFQRGIIVLAVMALALVIPGWMLYQNYDDHNRSGRTFQVDHARNILRECAPNAILFTGGDNDTFPLWYVQEVEGFRTDVRVMVLSYLNTDWYINQLRKKYYRSDAFRLTLDEDAYRQYGPNDALYIQEKINGPIDAAKYLHLLQQGYPGLRVRSASGDSFNILPSKTLAIANTSGDSAELASQQPVPLSPLLVGIKGNYLQKNALAIIDIAVSNHWSRPIYFNYTSLNTCGLELDRYVVQEGNLYRLVPQRSEGDDFALDTQLAYSNLVEKADYHNLENDKVYFNHEDYQARIITPVRQAFNSMAAALLAEGQIQRAAEAMRFATDRLYPDHLEPSYTNLQAAEILRALGEDGRARQLTQSLYDFQMNMLANNGGAAASPLDRYLLQEAENLLGQINPVDHDEESDSGR